MKDGAPAASRVEDVLQQRPLMSWINVGEVAYLTEQRRGAAVAEEVVETLRQRLTLDLPDANRILAAARLKAMHRISYADSFAVATALAYDAVLLTGDPEILAADPAWPVESLAP
jgi:predicted nucleic acid-binding protein